MVNMRLLFGVIKYQQMGSIKSNQSIALLIPGPPAITHAMT
jgi:hypothetical protein